MAETTAPPRTRSQQVMVAIGDLARWAPLVALGLLLSVQLVFFAMHAAHLLTYPYPLDYGEGPLLTQAGLLRDGTPIWRLYGDPGLPPYAVVNYPPVYHLATVLAALPLGGRAGAVLLAGRLVSLAATLGVVVVLWNLAGESRTRRRAPAGPGARRLVRAARFLGVLAFLAIPIVREWAVVMRVDMLGVCLGLWGLALVRRGAGRAAVLWAAIPLALSLLVKPSLLAAPAAALLWLLFRDWRRAIGLGALLAIVGAGVGGVLQLGSGGWFVLHVLSANANAWQRDLAYGFWHDQLVILWPLVAAAALSALAQAMRHAPRADLFLPLYYTLFGAIVALGVGKVGAYTNYFLECYAGLIWLVAIAARPRTNGHSPKVGGRTRTSLVFGLRSLVPPAVIVLVMAALLRYYPSWSETYLKRAGIIEGHNPPRVVVGRYGVWQDLRRERDILAALEGINAALDDELPATGGPIFTDVPGIAAQAGRLARMQVFEHRQLLDAGLWDQRPLLRDMANGRVPLVVLDYLGNWLTPEIIALITHRYGQDGSRGIYDLYRPIEPGLAMAADLAFPGGLRLVGYHLAPSPGRPAYHDGETALLTLEWRQESGSARQAPEPDGGLEVVVQVTDGQGHSVLETTRPLVYGVLRPGDWGADTIQHMQPIALPPELPPQTYQLALTLRSGGRDLTQPRVITPLVVEQSAGRQIGARGDYVPGPLLAEWARRGGDAGPGDPLMPAAPFKGYVLQCFARACLKLVGDTVQQLPLGALVHLGDVGLRPIDLGAPADRLSDGFRAFWQAQGGAAALGPAITPELARGEMMVQYTRYARLERPIAGGAARLARLGEEYLRLPGGVPYRWP